MTSVLSVAGKHVLLTKYNDRLELHGHGVCDCHPCVWLTHGCLWRRDGGEGEFFWNNRSRTRIANRVVVAWHYDKNGNKVVSGIMKFRVFRRRGRLHLESKGTYVHPSCRRRSLSTYMWTLALVRTDPEVVNAKVVSDRGLTLIDSLRKKFTYIRWHIVENARRKLRVLRRTR